MIGLPPGGATAPNPSTAAARVVLDELARCGVRHVVVCPGSRSTALAVAAHEHPELRVHVTLDERGAGYLAVGIGRATGEPAAVVVTSGTAVANLHPAVVEADHDRVPLLLLTADRPPELHGVGANQTIEQHGIFANSTRWVVDLGVPGTGPEEPARWRWTACRAHGTAVGRPVEVPAVVSLDAWQAPGPVQIDLPFREPTVPASDDGRTSAAPFTHPLDGRPDGAPWALSEVEPHVPVGHVVHAFADRLAAVEHGLVVVGGAVPGGVGPVLALAAKLGWPVLAEPHAFGRPGAERGATGGTPGTGGHGEQGPGVAPLAHGTLLLGAQPFRRDHEPELVLRVGRQTVAREVASLLEEAASVVVVDAHGGWVDRADERVQLVRGAVAPTLTAVLASLDDRGLPDREPGGDTNGGWVSDWQDADAALAAVVDRVLGTGTERRGPVTEPGVARTVLDVVPDGTAVVVGSSMPIRDVDLSAAPRPGVVVHANRGVSGIDGVVATALGVALGHAGPTVAIVGDLTLLHDSTAWLLREDPAGPPADLVLVAVDNDGGGIFSFLPQRIHVPAFERLFGTPHGVDLADLATLHQLAYTGPDALDDLAAVATAVTDGIAAGGRHLVHVRTDRDENVALHRRLRDEVEAALA